MPTRLLAVVLALAALPCGAAPSTLAAGRFGRALDARRGHAEAPAHDAYSRPPLTVECWARVYSQSGFSILVAQHPKASADHWEVYTYAGTGRLSAYLPGYTPAEVVSEAGVADGRWHFVAMSFDGSTVRLGVDGREVASRAVTRVPGMQRVPGPVTFGAIPTAGIGCDGLVDEVRISRVARPVGTLPTAPLAPDGDTLGLWRFDALGPRGRLDNLGTLRAPATAANVAGVSLDQLDRASFRPGPSPLDAAAAAAPLRPGEARHPAAPPVTLLDGTWQMAEGGEPADRLAGSWADAIPARVPGSVHSALQAAGRIPDPKFGRNDAVARAQSFKTWWFRRTFAAPAGVGGARLTFDGLAIHGTVWLNGRRLGEHEGMFGGPTFDVTRLLRSANTLVVRIHPAPGDPAAWNNPDWRKTVVFNNVWGWHYSSIPALGIWRSVRVERAPAVRLVAPYVATRDARAGQVSVLAGLEGGQGGTVTGTIRPETFPGGTLRFSVPVKPGQHTLHARLRIPGPRLWWPNGLGRADLYRLRLSFTPSGGGRPDTREVVFGIRSIRMAPLPGGPSSAQYNWTFVVNGRSVFVKGAGWCTMDSSMDFSRERYDRFLSLAADAHIQMLRCWGSGMPETDAFYDLCDRKGIMVLQEWPTAWDSHLVQPYGALQETVRLNTLRLRGHASLAMYGAGNESGSPFGRAIDMMGRLAVELDGTRPFHRAEPWGGSQHNYDCYWGRAPLDRNLHLTAPFFGEFGLAVMPVEESVLRYLPADERGAWPPRPDGALAHHTPIFNTAQDMERLSQYSAYFTPGRNLAEFVTGSQLSQVVGLRHTLELARTRWPHCTGALYYKLNDNYPAASWSTVDWYGAPKLGHYFVQQAFAPLTAVALLSTLDMRGRPAALPVWLLDDAGALRGHRWQVRARAFGGGLERVAEAVWNGRGSVGSGKRVGTLRLAPSAAARVPLLIVTEVSVDGRPAHRTFSCANYEARQGSLFTLPATRLALRVRGGTATVTNVGSVPAVGAAVLRKGHLDTFRASANYLWLDPGESRALRVNAAQGLTAEAWNAPPVSGR